MDGERLPLPYLEPARRSIPPKRRVATIKSIRCDKYPTHAHPTRALSCTPGRGPKNPNKLWPKNSCNACSLGPNTESMRKIAIALYQPDIPQNTGTILRMAACLDIHVHIIEPCGFALNDRTLRRAGMDYLERAAFTKHLSWEHFCDWHKGEDTRLVLATTKASRPFIDFEFANGDILLFGRESVGVPNEVHARTDDRITIPMHEGERSLNLAISTAMIASEALRQLKAFPK